MSNSNSIVIVLIICSLVCAALTNVYNTMDVNAQGADNLSLNTTGATEQNMTVNEDTLSPDPSNFTSETGVVTAQSGTTTPVSSCRELLACVKVYSSCDISTPPASTDKKLISCNPIVGNLFRIFPYLYENNGLIRFGPEGGIEASSSGKMITFPVKANTSATYVIRQDLSSFEANNLGNFFHIFQSGNGCTGEIKAGETKNCYIRSTLYVKFTG